MFIRIKIQLCNGLPIDTNLKRRFRIVTFMMGDQLVHQVPQNNFGHALHWRHRLRASEQITPQIKFTVLVCLGPCFSFSSQLKVTSLFSHICCCFISFVFSGFHLAGRFLEMLIYLGCDPALLHN